jgi:hypothetical protein
MATEGLMQLLDDAAATVGVSSGPRIIDLIEQTKGMFHIACDTEFEKAHTVSSQFAVRSGANLFIAVYHSPAVPGPPADFDMDAYLPDALRQHFGSIILQPVRTITAKLSPARVFAHLFDLKGLRFIKKQDGDRLKKTVDPALPLKLQLISHFWPADFCRIFGQEFFTSLIESRIQGGGRIIIHSHKLLGFKEVSRGANRHHDPILDYVREGDALHPVKIRTFDTILPFGKTSLDTHARTFLSVQKSDALSAQEKRHMIQTFRRSPAKCYGYAILDVILTLLIEERMQVEDRQMYSALGFDEDKIPPLRPTLGSRVAETIIKAVAKDAAAGSEALSNEGTKLKDGTMGAVSMTKLRNLLANGSGEFIAKERLSRFGKQTGETHGGLLFTRSPTRFFHEGIGQFCDIDLTSCYASIIGGMSMFVGRPLVFEPGPGKMRVKDAILFVQQHAAGTDSWIIKATGPITGMPNVLVPSTNGVLTHANYQSRAAKKRAKAKKRGFVFDWLCESKKTTGNATLYTDVVEAGFITWPTWLMIQTLPAAVRKSYENLETETIICYPAKLVANDGVQYDLLVEKYEKTEAPWEESIDLEAMEQVSVEHLDSDFVSLRFSIGHLAKQISAFRKEAREKHGKGSGADLAWKLHGNGVYGVLASPYLMTSNIVCANYITATARALAFAMQLGLNGFQVITDGCTFRRDQVPAGTFAECLAACPEYPINRAKFQGPFLDPKTIPNDDAGFTVWYREHIKHFFGVEGPDYDWLFGIHDLEHKKSGQPEETSFDGLCCDGSANYLKLKKVDAEWQVLDFKARSYAREEKEQLMPWVLRTYIKDEYIGPPPLTVSTRLLTYADAVRVGLKALAHVEAGRSVQEHNDDPTDIWFPLGLEQRKVQAYKVIKPSSFLCRTPDQRTKIVRAMQKFTDQHACGLEVLSLRRGHGGRRKGSIQDIAEALYEFNRSGKDNLTQVLNLTRSFKDLDAVQDTHYKVMLERRQAAEVELFEAISIEALDDNTLRTGLYLREWDIRKLS